ncbi:uncharacterized protein LAJ45_01250 [Morchella importuna]|uniref:uncharacterized protein n=1 Tax=Morchella importuna TaxID=1174673 RepID=UPI001E8D0DF0|nr:uncharacterized protein LAJ45_01250 [Morchella importuna]KAH8154719.1 hypothetical protein LAJ45_01250 [Morchella importuna]
MAMGVESLVALTTSNIIDEAKQGARSSTESEMASSNSCTFPTSPLRRTCSVDCLATKQPQSPAFERTISYQGTRVPAHQGSQKAQEREK